MQDLFHDHNPHKSEIGRDKKNIPRGIPKIGQTLRRHCSPIEVDDHDPEYSFCVVRHPVDWYKSIYRVKRARNKTYYVNGWKELTTFDNFIRDMCSMHPYGYVTSMYLRFIPFCSHILKLENLADDLSRLFGKWGFEKLPLLKTKNVSPDENTDLSRHFLELVQLVEWKIMQRLDYGAY